MCALALAFVMGAQAPALAAPSAGTIAEKRAEAQAAQAKMQRMQADLSVGMSEYTKVSGELATVRRQIETSTKRLAALETRLGQIEERLGDRASYLYRTRDSGPLDVLFSASTFDQFLERFDLLARWATEDASLITEGKKARAEAEELRAGLKKREARLVVLRDKSAAQRDKLTAALNDQRSYFGSLSDDVSALLAEQERAARAAAPASKPKRDGSGPKQRAGGGLAVASVEGRSGGYYVMSDEPLKYRPSGLSFTTEASRYSVAENGTGTASGRPLDDSELTCAHKTLPFGTRLAVKRGGRRVIVVVTDRGPYRPAGRDIDLSMRAASLLGISGIGDVHAEVVVPTD